MFRDTARVDAMAAHFDWLVREVKPAAENMDDLEKTVNRVAAATPEAFLKLHNAEGLNKKNINRVFALRR